MATPLWVRVTSSITSLLLILLFLPPFRSDWAIKRITPKGISNRGFQVHSHLLRGWHSGGGYIAIYNLPLTTETFSECHWIIISMAKITTFYKIANFFALCLIFSYICKCKGKGLAKNNKRYNKHLNFLRLCQCVVVRQVQPFQQFQTHLVRRISGRFRR